jgi:hypothetical protein
MSSGQAPSHRAATPTRAAAAAHRTIAALALVGAAVAVIVLAVTVGVMMPGRAAEPPAFSLGIGVPAGAAAAVLGAIGACFPTARRASRAALPPGLGSSATLGILLL